MYGGQVVFFSNDSTSTSQSPGILYRPPGEGSYPGLVLVPHCLHVTTVHRELGEKLAKLGYVSLVINNTDKQNQSCRNTKTDTSLESHYSRAAENYLREQSFVDPFRIGAVTWSVETLLALLEETEPRHKLNQKIRAVVGFANDCKPTDADNLPAPALVITGLASQSEIKPECLMRTKAPSTDTDTAYQRELFSNREKRQQSNFKLITRNLFHNNSEPKLALETATAEAIQFLNAKLRYKSTRLTLNDLPFNVTKQQAREATWIRHPRDYGDLLPAAGYSTFDLLFTKEQGNRREYQIPFPLPKLIEFVEAQLQPAEEGIETLRVAFIPHGRSLQKDSARPEQYKYPRTLIIPDREPIIRSGKQAPLLKDRLFIAYQEKAQVLEVISYNEDANRFEFQIVQDYGPNKQAKVHYANRELCISCHQNHAPIFSNAPWAETSRVIEVVRAMQNKQSNFYGIPAASTGISVLAIDRSVVAASAMLTYQQLWRYGCGNDNSETANRCRAGLFISVLQYAMTQYGTFDKSSLEYRNDFKATFARNWNQLWPNGLLIHAANIPDRDPFEHVYDLPLTLDPLTLRPPGEYWNHRREKDLNKVIGGLANELLQLDLYKLDRDLLRIASDNKTQNKTLKSKCNIEHLTQRSPYQNFAIDCRATNENSFDLSGKLSLREHEFIGKMDWLQVEGDYGPTRFDVRSTEISSDKTHHRIKFELSFVNTQAHVRLANGNAVLMLELHWPKANIDPTASVYSASSNTEADLLIAADFTPVQSAIAALLVKQGVKRDGIFSAQTFNGRKIMHALFGELGLDRNEWCCQINTMPKPTLAPIDVEVAAPSSTSESTQDLHLFYRHCASCHRSNSSTPPNFLAGDLTQVRKNLQQCAERIAVRLTMATLPEHQRTRSAMPPVPFDGLQTTLSTLLASTARMLGEQNTNVIPTQLLTKTYDKLRPCRPVF